MKKGFTLIELLIVMVLVGILITVALPKYRASMERGRGTEGISNLAAASDWANMQYQIKGSYPATSETASGSLSQPMYFDKPVYVDNTTLNTCPVNSFCIKTTRQQDGTAYYTLLAVNNSGSLEKIICTPAIGEERLCEVLGFDKLNNVWTMQFVR